MRELNNELQKSFSNFETLSYKDIIADTYYIEAKEDFSKFKKKLFDFKKELFIEYQNNPLFLKFSIDEIMIIGSLIEKEGFDYED